YSVIALCHYRTIIKRRKDYVLLENDWLGDTKLFTSVYYGTTNLNGEFEPKKVSWKRKTTGSLWWRKSRRVATIPKAEYDNYMIFWIDPEPCDSNCHENFKSETTIKNMVTCRL